jgi:hypothetical protein
VKFGETYRQTKKDRDTETHIGSLRKRDRKTDRETYWQSEKEG